MYRHGLARNGGAWQGRRGNHTGKFPVWFFIGGSGDKESSMCKLGAIGQREVEKVLRYQGWELVRTHGDHRQWSRVGQEGLVTVLATSKPYHQETLSRMLKQMCINKDAFAELLQRSR